MKKLVAILVCAFIMTGFGIGYGIWQIANNSVANSANECAIARSGCCSHHGGVCGCSGSRARCCDGTLSPSCGCY